MRHALLQVVACEERQAWLNTCCYTPGIEQLGCPTCCSYPICCAQLLLT
jgi:hypothetical protein